MAVQHGIWKIGDRPQPLETVKLDCESLLEDQITKDISILNGNWLCVSRRRNQDDMKMCA